MYAYITEGFDTTSENVSEKTFLSVIYLWLDASRNIELSIGLFYIGLLYMADKDQVISVKETFLRKFNIDS